MGGLKYKFGNIALLLLLVIGTAIVLLVFQDKFIHSEFYLFEKGTDSPIALQPVKIFRGSLCAESPCSGEYKLVFDGTTDEGGAIILTMEDAKNLNNPLGSGFLYDIKMESYYRPSRWDAKDILGQNKAYLTRGKI